MNNKELMRKRLMFQGGIEQENRMIQGKYRTLQKALFYSYQACTIAKIQPFYSCLGESNDEPRDVRALINPDKVKQDYDDKIISIPYEYDIGVGDVFEWRKTNTQWIVYLRQITEDAYFRGEIRRCRYIIKFRDDEGNVWETYAAIRGPVETQIESIQKNQVRVHRPNLSLNILIPRNDKTLAAFNRYSEFLFDGKCWRVEAPDSISMENIIEINAEEYYIDREYDDVKDEIKDGLVILPIDPTPDSEIIGDAFIRPKIPQTYTIDRENGTWSIKENCMPIKVIEQTPSAITIMWNKSTAHHEHFTLRYGNDAEKIITVESLF